MVITDAFSWSLLMLFMVITDAFVQLWVTGSTFFHWSCFAVLNCVCRAKNAQRHGSYNHKNCVVFSLDVCTDSQKVCYIKVSSPILLQQPAQMIQALLILNWAIV